MVTALFFRPKSLKPVASRRAAPASRTAHHLVGQVTYSIPVPHRRAEVGVARFVMVGHLTYSNTSFLPACHTALRRPVGHLTY